MSLQDYVNQVIASESGKARKGTRNSNLLTTGDIDALGY